MLDFTGSQNPSNVGKAKLTNTDQLSALVAQMPMPRSIRDSHRQLEDRVKSLRDLGGTALGPGLFMAIRLAGRVPGSRVVLVTDGCANEGLGCIENGPGKPGLEGPAFYPYVGGVAKELGVVVSVVTFAGTLIFKKFLTFIRLK